MAIGIIGLIVGVSIGVCIRGLSGEIKNNELLDEIYDLNKALCDKEQEYYKLRIEYNGLEENYDILIANYNRLKKFNDSTDKIITKLVEETKIGGTK